MGTIVAAAIVAGVWSASAWAEGGSIYTCIDAKGRRLTSDRPILDCIDREQQELGPSGKVVRKIGPSLTAEEQKAAEDRVRKETEEREHQLEEKRRDRALLARYPDRASHDKERKGQLAAVDVVIAAARERESELKWQRKQLDTELEFYGKDMKRAPALLKRHYADNDNAQATQERYIASQLEEKGRINARFDEELGRLAPLWAQVTAAAAASAASPSSGVKPASTARAASAAASARAPVRAKK